MRITNLFLSFVLLTALSSESLMAQGAKKISHSAAITGVKQRFKNANNEPGDAEKYYQQAVDLLISNNLAHDKDNKEKEETYYYLGSVYYRLNQFDKAYEAFQQCMSLGKKFTDKGEKISGGIELYSAKESLNDIRLKTYNKANAFFKETVNAKSPDSAKANAYRTIDKLTQLLKWDPKVTINDQSYAGGVYGSLVNVYIQLMNAESEEANRRPLREKIIDNLEKMFELDATNFSVVYNIIGLHQQNQNNDQVLKWIEKALTIQDTASTTIAVKAQLVATKALILDTQGKSEEALQVYLKAIAADPNNSDLHFNLARLYIQKKELDKAIAEFREVKRIKKDDLEATYQVANESFRLYQTKRSATIDANGGAAANMKKVTELVRQTIENAQTDIKDALAAWEPQIGMVQDQAEANYRIGTMYNYMAQLEGDLNYGLENAAKVKKQRPYFEKALPYLKKATELKPDSANAWTMLGTAYLNLQMKKEGEAALKKAGSIK